MDIRCVVCQSLKELDCWLSSPEMAFLAMNGGFEGTVRDRLMYQIQKLRHDEVVRSEKSVQGKKPDIEILHKAKKDEKDEPLALAIIELKHNFLFHSDVFKGVEGDMKKWSGIKPPIPLFFIQIVIQIEKITGDMVHFLKYKEAKPREPKKTEKRLKEIEDYFCKLERKEKGILKTHMTRAVSKYPFELTTSLTFFILEIRSNKDHVQEMREKCKQCDLMTVTSCLEKI